MNIFLLALVYCRCNPHFNTLQLTIMFVIGCSTRGTERVSTARGRLRGIAQRRTAAELGGGSAYTRQGEWWEAGENYLTRKRNIDMYFGIA